MRIIVTGATGNLGTRVVESLRASREVDDIVAVARHEPERGMRGARFVRADVAKDELEPLFRSADAVIHLAWLVQPARKRKKLEAVNVEGSRRVFRAAMRAGVRQLVVASSVGAYSPGPKHRKVDENWPTLGIRTSLYSQQKAAVERMLDQLEWRAPRMIVTRIRPALVFQRAAGSEIKRLFIGRLLPRFLLGPSTIPIVPDVPSLRFQAVHASDVGHAFRLAVERQAPGPFNLAADPVLDSATLARTLDAKPIAMSARTLRALMATSYRLRLQPADPGWLDMTLNVPLLDTQRAERELGWNATVSSTSALLELLDGIRAGAGAPTPPLEPTRASR